MTILATCQLALIIFNYLSSYVLVDNLFYYGLAFGVYKNSRISAVLLFLLFIFNRFYSFEKSQDLSALFGSLSITVCFLLLLGIIGTFAYNEIKKEREINKIGDDSGLPITS